MSNETNTNVLAENTTTNLAEKAAALAAARQKHAERKAQLDAARAAWENANRNLIESVEQLKHDAAEADRALREAALAEYEATGHAKPLDGIEVKLWDHMTFDSMLATIWCRDNMPALLVLDEAAYKKVLKEVCTSKVLSAIISMPGTVTQEPKPSIARDLSRHLDEPAPAPAATATEVPA